MSDLGKLEKCKVKEQWHSENDFSDWLYDHIEYLTEALGLDEIQSLSREDNVGTLRADIYGEETSTGRRIIIENQYGNSDHDHLGKIITYAAGKDADIIIWIVEVAREEHTSAIEWLNLNSSPNKGYFLVEIGLWRIGESQRAPQFNIVERPNTWIQSERAEMNESEKFKMSFWRQFIEYSASNKRLLKAYPGTNTRKGSSAHWFSFYKGCNKNFHIECLVSSDGGMIESIGAQVWIKDDKELFRRLEGHKQEIEGEFGFEAMWDYKEEKKASSIRVRKNVEPNVKDYHEHFEWLADKAIVMRDVINKYT